MNSGLGEFTFKVPGGKLVRATVKFKEKIENAKITGDFFLYPEEAIKDIECCLEFCTPLESEAELATRIAKALAMTRAELHGVSTQDIARAVKGAIQNAK